MAMAGAAATIATGSTTAIATIASTARRSSDMSGDDSSTTGRSAQADIDHSEVRLDTGQRRDQRRKKTAAPRTSTATSRRARASAGQSMSARAPREWVAWRRTPEATGNTT